MEFSVSLETCQPVPYDLTQVPESVPTYDLAADDGTEPFPGQQTEHTSGTNQKKNKKKRKVVTWSVPDVAPQVDPGELMTALSTCAGGERYYIPPLNELQHLSGPVLPTLPSNNKRQKRSKVKKTGKGGRRKSGGQDFCSLAMPSVVHDATRTGSLCVGQNFENMSHADRESAVLRCQQYLERERAIRCGKYSFGHAVVMSTFQAPDTQLQLLLNLSVPATFGNLLAFYHLLGWGTFDTYMGYVAFWPLTIYTDARKEHGYPVIAVHRGHYTAYLQRLHRMSVDGLLGHQVFQNLTVDGQSLFHDRDTEAETFLQYDAVEARNKITPLTGLEPETDRHFSRLREWSPVEKQATAGRRGRPARPLDQTDFRKGYILLPAFVVWTMSNYFIDSTGKPKPLVNMLQCFYRDTIPEMVTLLDIEGVSSALLGPPNISFPDTMSVVADQDADVRRGYLSLRPAAGKTHFDDTIRPFEISKPCSAVTSGNIRWRSDVYMYGLRLHAEQMKATWTAYCLIMLVNVSEYKQPRFLLSLCCPRLERTPYSKEEVMDMGIQVTTNKKRTATQATLRKLSYQLHVPTIEDTSNEQSSQRRKLSDREQRAKALIQASNIIRKLDRGS